MGEAPIVWPTVIGRLQCRNGQKLPLSMRVTCLSNVVEKVNVSNMNSREKLAILGMVIAYAVAVQKLILVVGVTVLAVFVTHAIAVTAFVRVQVIEDNAARHDTGLLQPFGGFLNFGQG